MKNPLSYQITEYDCGPTTMFNAISYLFKREEILPEIVKHILLYTLDGYNAQGESGKNGTSGIAMRFLCSWLNQFGKVKQFPILCEELRSDDVFVSQNSRIVAGLQQGGVAVVRLRYGCWHYVLFTGADDTHVYLFDPYFRKKPFASSEIEIITDEPAKYNRKVPYSFFNSEKRGPYALGPKSSREAFLLFNSTSRKTSESIEYFI